MDQRLSRRDLLATAAAGGLLLTDKSAQGQGKDGPHKPLRAGAAVTDITPTLGVSLTGIIMRHGPAKEVHDRLQARCLALDDGSTRLAIVLCDVTLISREIMEQAKALAHKHTGLPTERMLVAVTHTHMAPRMAGWVAGKLDKEYYDLVTRRVAEAIGQAVSNLAPAKVGWGVGSKPEFVRNRRWIMKPGTVPPNPFGGTDDQVVMGGHPAKNRLRPAGPVDPDLCVLSIQHADGRPLALLANYGIHYVTCRRACVSADYFGHFAKRVGELLGAEDVEPPFVGIMSNGASGDIGAVGGGFDKVRKVGDALAAEALRVCRTIQHRGRVTLAMRETELELAVQRPDAARLAWARKVLAEPRSKSLHRWRRIFADEALHLSRFPATVRLKLQALRIGGLGIAAIPCEVFAETGLAIKRDSPLEPTFTIMLANGYNGYLPTPEQYKLGGFETWPRRGTYLELEASTKIREAVMGLIRQVAADRPETRS
jgi:hypothetical protein